MHLNVEKNVVSSLKLCQFLDTSSSTTTLPPTTRISISTTLPETGRQKTEITNPITGIMMTIIIIIIIIIKVLHFWEILAYIIIVFFHSASQ